MDGWLDKWRGLYGLNNLKSGGCWIRVFVPFLLLFSFHFSIVSYSGVFFFFVFVGLAARKQFGKKIYGPLESNVTIANDMLARKYITTQQITRNDEQKKKWAKWGFEQNNEIYQKCVCSIREWRGFRESYLPDNRTYIHRHKHTPLLHCK